MSEIEPQTEAAQPLAQETWSGLVTEDYDRAVVRLATLRRKGESHLLFGSVELLPPEIRSPPEAEVRQGFGADQAQFNRYVLSIPEALAWYQSAWNGDLVVPRSGAPLKAENLQPEPATHRFVLRGDVPFSPAWHVTPRLHRLTPMGEPAAPIASLLAKLGQNDRVERIRQWLEARLHFDVLAHDEWLGGVALVLPNPLFRDHGGWIAGRTAKGEVLEAGGAARRGASLDGVQVIFQEERAGGLGHFAQGPVDPGGRASTEVTGEVDRLGHRVVCARRGLLHDDPPAWFFRSISSSVSTSSRVRVANVPARSKGEAPRQVQFHVSKPPPPDDPPRNALFRVMQLQARQANRTGAVGPQKPDLDGDDCRVFERADRDATVAFLRRLIGRARRRVTFVDPWFEAADLPDFAYAPSFEGVDVEVLLGPRDADLQKAPDFGPEGIATKGDWMVSELAVMRGPDKGFGSVEARVTTRHSFHDRFLRIDDEIWHCGHSFNGVARTGISAMTRVGRPARLSALIDEVFRQSEPFESYWARTSKAPPSGDAPAAAQGDLDGD